MYLRLITFNIVLLICTYALADKQTSNQIYYKQFQEIFERINKDYVQDPDKQKMTDSAINGMLTSLDPHSGYYTDEDLDDFINQTKGEFGGIGVEVMYDNGAIKVISPIDDLPADKAGIKAGDYIVGVNDELVSTIGFNKAVKEMRGEPGTKVKLFVIKNDEVKPQDVELTREIVKIKPIKSHLEEGGIAYVRIVTFNEHTIQEMKKAFKSVEASNTADGGIKGIILDLRNNPGGLLDQAIAVSEYFIDSGTIVSTKGRTDTNNSVLTASKFTAKAPNVPIVVLINSGSASASEIVAGALQDYKRAIILGTKSFGKGSVQTFVQVSPRAAVKLTTARYYTPLGRSIQAEGIEPDIIIEPAKVEYPGQKNEERRFSESSLKNYLKNDNKDLKDNEQKKDKDKLKKDKDKPELKIEKAENYQPSELYKKDYQFARAYDLIRGLILSKNK
ncbi:S41 family peptidase [Candidatus Trichorickettsia mobilis]|uniref:S41 family peptidase n=1 Tax=Candidatus Trichorickettsia mobilis TaxID=1346319 RepID=A0ABZ0UVU4_9RICK|nr:S41 family peptidase [Candidatus Trichorickettsia mobilis]WPY00149.1 S41 family peptidase [Candidatus Trichorickettsia mobilis]